MSNRRFMPLPFVYPRCIYELSCPFSHRMSKNGLPYISCAALISSHVCVCFWLPLFNFFRRYYFLLSFFHKFIRMDTKTIVHGFWFLFPYWLETKDVDGDDDERGGCFYMCCIVRWL